MANSGIALANNRCIRRLRMRIQDTDRILKESRYARHAASTVQDEGVMSRTWRMVSSLPAKLTGMFKR
jgi:hypothetical protein